MQGQAGERLLNCSPCLLGFRCPVRLCLIGLALQGVGLMLGLSLPPAVEVGDLSIGDTVEPGIQLTWMDAQVGTWVVTPRQGKMVEINALWYNALKIMSNMYMKCNKKASALAYKKRAQHIQESFNRVFWNPTNQSLYDYVDGEYRESSIRYHRHRHT